MVFFAFIKSNSNPGPYLSPYPKLKDFWQKINSSGVPTWTPHFTCPPNFSLSSPDLAAPYPWDPPQFFPPHPAPHVVAHGGTAPPRHPRSRDTGPRSRAAAAAVEPSCAGVQEQEGRRPTPAVAATLAGRLLLPRGAEQQLVHASISTPPAHLHHPAGLHRHAHPSSSSSPVEISLVILPVEVLLCCPHL